MVKIALLDQKPFSNECSNKKKYNSYNNNYKEWFFWQVSDLINSASN